MAIPVFAKLSLGYLADRIAHMIGWSPLAKSIAIFGAEGPHANLFEGVIGTVLSVDQGAMILELDRTLHLSMSQGSRLILTARHKGWTPHSLCFRPIAVVAEALQPDGQRGPVAIAMAMVIRKRGLEGRG